MFRLYSGRVVHIKKVWDDYLTLMLHSPSPTIDSLLNFGTSDRARPSEKDGIVPNTNDSVSAFGLYKK